MSVGTDSSSVAGSSGSEVPDEAAPRLMLVNTVPFQPGEDSTVPDLDIIHVVGVDPERRLGLHTVIGDSVPSRTREFIFQCEISTLLLGDLVFNEIQNQALELLGGIVASSENDKAVHPARIFIAYDLGALVVKKAIAIASSRESQWSGIFYSTVQFIYWRCFQRRRKLQAFETKIWQFLQAHKGNALWASLVTPMSIRALAEASVETTEVFLSSHITLRTPIVSIYVNEDSETTDSIFDCFTATLGVTTEIAVQEKPNNQHEPVSGLEKMVCYRTQNWVSHPEWTALQGMLLPLALPQYQHTVERPESSPRVLASKAYKGWATTPRSPVLYIQGRDEAHSKSLADNVFLFQQSKLREKQVYEIPIFSFAFSSRDPARDTMNPMMCSTLIQFLCAISSESPHPKTSIFFDLYHLQKGWTFKDLCNMLLRFPVSSPWMGMLLVLHDVDECELTSRKYFWDVLHCLTESSDSYIKVIVTSRRKLSLLTDSEKTSLWYLYDHSKEDELEEASLSLTRHPASLVSTLCPGGHGETRVRNALEALVGIDQTNLERILSLIQDHTNWPNVPSLGAWSNFCALLDRVQPSTSPAITLDWILRLSPDQVGLRWVLHWLVYGHRPLSSSELACLFRHCNRGQGYQSVSSPTPIEVEESLQLLKSWLSALVQFSHDQVCIRKPLWDLLLEDDPNYLWNEIKPIAHQTILDFLSLYLTTPEVRNRLVEMYDRYLLSYNADDHHLTPSVQPDGEDFIFYAITAFPYHLEKSPQSVQQLEYLFCSPEQPLTPWARMYWAMSNPFSRPSVKTTDSAFSVLLSTANLDATLRKSLTSAMAASFPPAGLSNTPRESGDSADMDALVRAVSVGDEEAALKHTQHILSRTSSGNGTGAVGITATVAATGDNSWLSRLLWRAAWLNMDRLAGLLLRTQMPPDPEDLVSAGYTSPLYLASRLGHYRIVQTLLNAGANSRVLGRGEYSVLFTAAGKGHNNTVLILVDKDKDLLRMNQPKSPLYIASEWGQWMVVKTLIDLGAQVNVTHESDRWSPLIVAANSGYARTVRALLEKDANPNLPGPGDQDTSLWFAAMRGESVDCVRALLEYGADPNHEFIQPPLVVEICSSSDISLEKKIDILDALIDNSPPIDINKVDSNGTSGLMWAATTGDTALVEWLLSHNANVHATSDESYSALYFAVTNGHQEVIRKLLVMGAPVNIVTSAGETLLQLSVDKGVEQIGMLLDADANLELENGSGQTVLNTAIEQEKPGVVKLLIDRKVNIHHRDRSGWSPIHDASGFRPNAEVARLLIDAGASLTEVTKSGQTPLHLAASQCRPEIIAVLLEFRSALDIQQRNDDGETPLLSAVLGGNLECIRRLLQAGADINTQCSNGWTPLMRAIYLDEPHEVVSFLLSRPDLEISRSSPKLGAALHIACARLDLATVIKLLDKGADVNQQLPGFRPTPLMAACIPRNTSNSSTRGENLNNIDQIVRILVDRGADIHAKHSNPVPTILCAAALYSGPSTINYLVSKGLSLEEKGCLDRLPIHYAAFSGRENFETVLLGNSTLLSKDIAGKTALHWAAQFSHVQTVEIILARAYSPKEKLERLNQRDNDGWTALCWALRPDTTSSSKIYSEPYDLTRTVQLLIESGADVPTSCRMGREDEKFTALEIAKLHNASDEIISLLRKADTAHSAEDETTGSIRAYQEHDYYCDICLSTIWGPVLRCEICPEFDACKKCYGQIDLYHGHLKQESGEPHTFKVLVEAPPERQGPSESGVQPSGSSSRASSEGNNSQDESEHDDTI